MLDCLKDKDNIVLYIINKRVDMDDMRWCDLF